MACSSSVVKGTEGGGARSDASAEEMVPGDLATAKADTQAYLLALRAHMKKVVDDGVDVSAAVKSFDSKPFARLLNAAELMPGNGSRTYLELERE